ncbi:MAG: SRPBCC domain-containing protein [Deltaproteobacteria bacterium]|nr:SRPBCC domain-containing protein [Deltaproteobacteria bacterium]MCB9478931.1 SRPBCC domain-containing protein [Deltaproteobacteria bacterium]MCB9489435.1 SRPBCC domain-containing protein [Deltaproteobacteria bacterium]
MPIRHDAERRWVEMKFELPGTVEQVWQAVATGPGISAWFTPTTVEEKEGGAIAFDMGDGMVSPATITAWEPPHRFSYVEKEWNGDAPPVSTDVFVEKDADGRTVVRMTHTMESAESEWDEHMEGFEAGWPTFFLILSIYLRDFPEQPAAIAWARGIYPGPADEGWNRLISGLGLEQAAIGEACVSAQGAPRLAGTVLERRHGDNGVNDMQIRLTEPYPGVATMGTCVWEGTTLAMVGLYLWGDQAAEAASEFHPRLKAWMDELFPMPDTPAPEGA